MIDKVLITNVAALKKKYGVQGYRAIRSEVRSLVSADWDLRRLTTKLIDVSDVSQMKKFRTRRVSNADSEWENKTAVDAVYAALLPHYVVLLDGPDVIPHIKLVNPIPADDDGDIPSDLSYASDAPYSGRNAAEYAIVTRVVGRIPGATGTDDPSFLIAQLKAAGAAKSRPRKHYLPHFSISAYIWRKSTELSVDNVFHSAPTNLSPPTDSSRVRTKLAPLSHFINCHGRKDDSNFYGQRGSQIAIAMTSDDVVKGARRNTVDGAECCFGAQLFAPTQSGEVPIANAYLNAGAIGFFGSTTTSYGSPKGNGSADLMVQYFLIDVLSGSSIGRACLYARQRFVQSQLMESPVNLKTLAQFLLLGDPSVQPVRGTEETNLRLKSRSENFLSRMNRM
jgi:hypothetical protein